MNATVLPRFLRHFSWDVAISTVIGTLAYAVLAGLAHWNVIVALIAGMAVVFTVRAVFDIWPRRVPPELAGEMRKLEADGWRPLRHHPFFCEERRAHMHVTKPGGKPVTVTFLREEG